MKNSLKQVTKEWFKCKPFEKILATIWEENPGIRFSRQQLLDRINRGEFGENLVATNSPEQGKVEDILTDYQKKGQEWLDIQNLTYHYSHHNPNGHFHSQKQMLDHISGIGDDSIYKLHQEAFASH